MKPRRHNCPATKEDIEIWQQVMQRAVCCSLCKRPAGDTGYRSMLADRRDSDLMLKREQAKAADPFSFIMNRREWFPSMWGLSDEWPRINPRTP